MKILMQNVKESLKALGRKCVRVGSKGAPTAEDFKQSAKTAKVK
jgi:hypothetical protein